MPAPLHIPRLQFSVSVPNEVHQADLLFLPHDLLPHCWKVFKYAMTVTNVASHFKDVEPVRWLVLSHAYEHEFMGSLSQLLAECGVSVQYGERETHHGQTVVEWIVVDALDPCWYCMGT